MSQVSYKLISPIPVEFVRKGTMEWKIFELKSKKYDAIIGMNFLILLQAKINILSKNIEIFSKFIIPFIENEYIFIEIAEANQLEPVENKENIISKVKTSHLNKEESKCLKGIIEGNLDLFYGEGDNLTFTHEIKHEIRLTNSNPVYSKIYRYPQIHEKEIENQIRDMLNQGIIQESNSPYNSPLWIVPKKMDNSGKQKWRIVIDYRKINELTTSDKFPIPNIENILDKLGRAQYFTTLDLAKGFHQIIVKEEDRKKTAFSTPFGHYEYIRMPFGLKNAPSTFQRLMNSVLREFINKICVCYMDDILIFSTSIQEHVSNVKTIFNCLREANLKIQIDKCNFFSKETEFLGHVLTPNGILPNPNKIKDITELKLPETQKQIKSFLGITGYYRKFIKDYAKIAQPLTKFLKKDSRINKLDPSYIHAFETMKTLMTTHPILKYPDFTKEFKLNTDASNFAIGAVLLQDNHPIAYASRTLNDHEIRYNTTEKELLAVVWAIKYFRPYIYGKEFELKTDHQALKWLHTKYLGKDLNPRLQRWILSLGEYNFKIEYLKGKENYIADFLSRINTDEHEINELSETINSGEERNQLLDAQPNNNLLNDNISMQATIHSQEEQVNEDIPYLETVVNRFKVQIIIQQEQIPRIETGMGNIRISINPKVTEQDIINFIGPYTHVKRIAIYTQISDHDFYQIQKILTKEFPRNIFFRCTHFAQDIEMEEKLIKAVAIQHKEQGHPGIIALYQNLKFKIYNKDLRLIINKVTNNCDNCNRAKYDRNPIKAKFKKTEIPTDKNQIIHLDTYVNRKQSFLVFIDKFTKFASAYPVENRSHVELIEKLKIYFNHKKPRKIVADNEFKHINIKEFLNKENVELHLVKPNSHTGNSDVERLNGTITEKLRILNLENSLPVRTQMLKAIEIYNNQYHNTIASTPRDAEEGKIKTEIIRKHLLDSQEKRLRRNNENRENYEETREEGYIKYYKSLRHKDEPKYRKYNLQNIHTNNIKRKNKFSDTDRNTNTTDRSTTDHDATTSGQD